MQLTVNDIAATDQQVRGNVSHNADSIIRGLVDAHPRGFVIIYLWDTVYRHVGTRIAIQIRRNSISSYENI